MSAKHPPELLVAAKQGRTQLGVFMIGRGTKGSSCACGARALADDPLQHKPGCVIAVLDAAIAAAELR